MTLQKVSLLSDGRLKALYSDGDVVILSRNGAMFAYVSGDSVVRQTCAFAVSKYTERLCTVLSFRNMHLDAVVWCRALERQHKSEIFKLGYPLSYVRWPENLTQTLSDGRISLQSEDETARLVLHPHGRRFAVCFPLLVGKTTDDEGNVSFHFVWQTQVFATVDCPARWVYPLNMAQLALKRQRGREREDHGEQSTISEDAQQLTHNGTGTESDAHKAEAMSVLPESTFADATQDQLGNALIQRTTHLPYAAEPPYENPNFFEEASWWTNSAPSAMPSREIVQICWTPEVFMQFIPSVREVHAWVAQDESFICTSDSGQFLRHQRAPDAELLYRTNALPVHAWSADGGGRYAFQAIAQAVLKFREHALSVLDAQAIQQSAESNAAAKIAEPEVLSNEIKAEQRVPRVGVFTAFVDGRIRARFADRTLVAVDRWHRTAEIVGRDSTCSTVLVSAPHGVTEYVKATMEFAHWAFMTKEARAEAERNRMAVNAALKATKCTKALCEYALTSTLPEEIATEECSRPARSDAASLRASRHGTQLETPSLQTRTQPTIGTTSSCEDPPTGWTVSNHGGPQRAFLGVPKLLGQQENIPPSSCRQTHVTAEDGRSSVAGKHGSSLHQHPGQHSHLQSLKHGDQPRVSKICTHFPEAVLEGPLNDGANEVPSFSGDRDTLVEQWLKKNSQLLESLNV